MTTDVLRDPYTLTPAEAAKIIAEEIRSNGHYQGERSPGDKSSCLVANNCFGVLSGQTQYQLLEQIRNQAVHTEAWRNVPSGHSLRSLMMWWNDQAPTEQVLEILDSIAAEADK